VINGASATITGNTVGGSVGDGMVVNGDSTTVTGNTITYNLGNGIVVNGTNPTVTGNTANYNGFTGIIVNGADAPGNTENYNRFLDLDSPGSNLFNFLGFFGIIIGGVLGEETVASGLLLVGGETIAELSIAVPIVGLFVVTALADAWFIQNYPEQAIPANLKAIPGIGIILSTYALQSVIRGEGDPLNPEKLEKNSLEGAYLLLLLSEDDDFENTVTEMLNGNSPDDKRIKLDKEFRDKLASLQGSGGIDDPDELKKRLREAMNKAVTEKKWATVATLTATGLLWASYSFLKTLNQK
jgi:parallel beta-helix repeat protein